MIPEIGQFALIMALCMTLVQAVLPILGAARGVPEWMAVARPAVRAQFTLLLIAFVCLTYAMVTSDFSVRYVAVNSNLALPTIYKISAVWGAHEGSLLLWALMLSLWSIAVSVFSRGLPQEFLARVIGVMGVVSFGFVLFMLTTSNPFERLIPATMQAGDLNPLLQDPALIIHPPMLYMGYVGFSVAFSFAIAALLGGQLDAVWARWSRPWTVAAWIFLTVGITLGSWWAYYELGWGGWWFWDPVENASFMPWLVGTALIHSLAVTEKRGTFKAWTVLLAISAFSLSLLGTFLVRSGVLTSVHAFATDPARGVFILVFLCVVIGGSLLLYAWRAPRVVGGGAFDVVSRETLLLANNVLLIVAAATILLGTLYPIILDAFGLGKISVGPPYFNSVFVPLMTPLLVLMVLGPMSRWKRSDPRELARTLRFAFAASMVAGVAYLLLSGNARSVGVLLAVVLAGWILFGTLQAILARVADKPNPVLALARQPRGFYGMCLAHLGIATLAVGVTVTSVYSIEKDVTMNLGDQIEIGGYTFVFRGTENTRGPNYDAITSTVEVLKGSNTIALLHPEKRFYPGQSSPMTEAGIQAGFTRDLYVSLGEAIGSGGWSFKIQYKPFVRWIWLAGIMMACGGILAATDRRYRLTLRRAPQEVSASTMRVPEATGA